MNVPARESLGLLEYAKGNHAEADRSMKEAISLHSANYLIYYYDAMLSSEGSATEDAEEDLRKSIALNANFAASYSALASMLARRERKIAEAFTLGQKAGQLEPEPWHGGSISDKYSSKWTVPRMR